MTLVSNVIDKCVHGGKLFMDFEIYCGKHILRNFILYSEINVINKFPNKLQISFMH